MKAVINIKHKVIHVSSIKYQIMRTTEQSNEATIQFFSATEKWSWLTRGRERYCILARAWEDHSCYHTATEGKGSRWDRKTIDWITEGGTERSNAIAVSPSFVFWSQHTWVIVSQGENSSKQRPAAMLLLLRRVTDWWLHGVDDNVRWGSDVMREMWW